VGFKSMYYVYILKCIDNRTYIGCCNDLRDRLDRHKKGSVPATKDRLPIKLISYFAFFNKHTAFNFEKYLKSGSGRAFLKKHVIID
jgi:putative endonuclease